MKGYVLIVSLLCFGASANVSGNQILNSLAAELVQYAIPDPHAYVISILKTFDFEEIAKGVFAPVIPDLPDPLVLDNFNISIPEFELGRLELAVWDSEITGLSTIVDDFTFSFAGGTRIQVNYTFDIDYASIDGDYEGDATVKLDFLEVPPFDLSGNGAYHGNISKAFVRFGAVIGLIPGTIRPEMKEMLLDLGFQGVDVSLENFELNGIPFDAWDDINEALLSLFNLAWRLIRGPLQDIVIYVVNSMIDTCTILDLIGIIGGGNLTCLSEPEFPPFTLPPATTTTPRPITTSTTKPVTWETTDSNDPDPSTSEPDHSTEAGVSKLSLLSKEVAAVSVLLAMYIIY